MWDIQVKRNHSSNPWTYSDLDREQRKKSDHPRIFISELSPVITLGRRAQKSDLLFSEQKLNELGISLYSADRGGLATYHGPGQWVVFVVDKLENLVGDSRGVGKAVCLLLKAAQEITNKFKIETEIKSGAELGLWTKKGKIAAVGVSVQDGVLYHGFSVNIFRTETSFVGLKPCGLDAAVDYVVDKPVSDSEFNDLGHWISDLTASQIQSYKHSIYRSNCNVRA
jgi:lipoate-protein ligase B